MRKTVILWALAIVALFPSVLSVARAHSPLPVAVAPASTHTPPAAVKAAITKLYPTVKNVKFEKEAGDYEASFTHNGKDISVVLDAQGNVKETETTIATSALPTAVRDYVARHHAGKKIKEAAEIVAAKGRKTFEAEVGGKDLIFDEKGAVIK